MSNASQACAKTVTESKEYTKTTITSTLTQLKGRAWCVGIKGSPNLAVYATAIGGDDSIMGAIDRNGKHSDAACSQKSMLSASG